MLCGYLYPLENSAEVKDLGTNLARPKNRKRPVNSSRQLAILETEIIAAIVELS